MLASVYPDDVERGNAMGIALGGLAMGVLSKQNLLFLFTFTKFTKNKNLLSWTSFWRSCI